MPDPLGELSADLRGAAGEVRKGAYGVVKKGAVNIKKDWRANARESAGAHAKHYPGTIGFDITREDADEIVAVIGPADRGQGELGPILEFGSPHSPPHNDGGRALRAEQDRFEQALANLAEDALS